jgi:hypothetical protein
LRLRLRLRLPLLLLLLLLLLPVLLLLLMLLLLLLLRTAVATRMSVNRHQPYAAQAARAGCSGNGSSSSSSSSSCRHSGRSGDHRAGHRAHVLRAGTCCAPQRRAARRPFPRRRPHAAAAPTAAAAAVPVAPAPAARVAPAPAARVPTRTQPQLAEVVVEDQHATTHVRLAVVTRVVMRCPHLWGQWRPSPAKHVSPDFLVLINYY